MKLDHSAHDSRDFSEEKSGVKKYKKKPAAKRRVVVQLMGGVDRPFLITVILLLCLGTVAA